MLVVSRLQGGQLCLTLGVQATADERNWILSKLKVVSSGSFCERFMSRNSQRACSKVRMGMK